MNAYVISLGTGVLIGLVYALLNVRSPAPPAIALIGLLGMLIGEQLVALAVRQASAAQVTTRHEATAAMVKTLAAQGAVSATDASLSGGPSTPGEGI